MGQSTLRGSRFTPYTLTNMVLQQRYIPEHNIIISMEVFHELVPAWRMLHSSTSALGHDQTDEHCLSNHMLSDCLVLGSHNYVSTVTDCIKLFLSHSRVGFARTALGSFFAHPGHVVVGTVAVSDSWVRLELRLLCTVDVLCTRLEPVVSAALHTRLGCDKTAAARPVVVHASPQTARPLLSDRAQSEDAI